MDKQKLKFSDKKGKIRDVLLILGLALLLLIAIWKIFYTDNSTQNIAILKSEEEKNLCRLLSEMDGVGEVDVMICETEDGIKSAVIVCDGANNIRVNTQVRKAAASALGVDEKNICVFLKKE